MNWVQKLLDNQKEKLIDKQKVHNQPNQTQIQIMIERRDPLFALKEERTVLRKSKHVPLVKKLNENHDRAVRPVVCSQRASQARFSRDSKNFNLEEEANHERMERPVVCSQSKRSMFNEVDIDFRISRLPHSVVKQSENSRVRELLKKIENHPHRQALQNDPQQNIAYNPFSEKSKKMIKDMGNVELFETDPKTQCKECLLYWSQGIVCCTCGHLLKESEANRGAIQLTLDHYVIKKGRPHGQRYEKTKENNILPIL